MMIWRGLDPKLLGRLLVAAAEALAKDRPTDRHFTAGPPEFRHPLVIEGAENGDSGRKKSAG